MSVERSLSMWIQNDPTEILYHGARRIIRDAVADIGGSDVNAIGAQIAEELIFPAINRHHPAGSLIEEIFNHVDWSEIIGDDIDAEQKRQEQEEENTCAYCGDAVGECGCGEECEGCYNIPAECTCDDEDANQEA